MDTAAARDRMVDDLVDRGRISDERVAAALRNVPRHEFVPGVSVREAYADRPLEIGEGQTISAPHMVAIMAELLDVSPADRVLEIGTGCGYHAAVTSELAGQVYSVEYHERLAETARERFDRLGYDVRVRAGDGREGWHEHAPYDACYLTCAASEVPDALFEQVREGGRLLAPVGDRSQTLYLYDHDGDDWHRTNHGGVRFVPLLG
ncbi:protein-L-isoaspartate(D-aspartate) O-methyltransferase [Halorarius litoreus]|uniref:protein-L-isoaspartate(D-aspartate) O-methyltransferase n=1 Tax=Halorarius litoreus TaxID=2962676 RepID=UPI0020CCA43E|nr:protein-L-isoaspartate(D-aspartate) O-methyltransferase [Halorarius litoreus]